MSTIHLPISSAALESVRVLAKDEGISPELWCFRRLAAVVSEHVGLFHNYTVFGPADAGNGKTVDMLSIPEPILADGPGTIALDLPDEVIHDIEGVVRALTATNPAIGISVTWHSPREWLESVLHEKIVAALVQRTRIRLAAVEANLR
jgi:hypothetical protein